LLSAANAADPTDDEPVAEVLESDQNREVPGDDATCLREEATAADPQPTDELQPDATPARGPGVGLEELLTRRQRNRRLKGRLARPEAASTGEGQRSSFTPEQRLLLLDTWLRSGLPAGDFATLVGLSKHTLYKWKQAFDEQGPAGLMDQPRGVRPGSRVPEVTKRAILMLKEQHPEWGCQRISDMLVRGPALPASAATVARVLHEAGYQWVQEATRAHRPKKCRFERAKPNQLWQTDLFTFMLKRQNRRVYLVAFLDDHSRFLVGFGLHASASTALVLEALEAAIAAWGPPEEILSDNGPQYVTWRGKSQFTRHLEKRGIRQIVARPRRPQTLGKIERFWGTLWREFLETAVFQDLADARTRIGHFMDYYNLQRAHRGLEGLVPADRFFGAASEVLQTLKQRVSVNALELARQGAPKAPFYVTGQIEGQAFSVHAEGPRLILRKAGQPRQEIDLAAPADTASSGTAASNACEPATAAERGAHDALPVPLCPSGAPADRAGEPACQPPLPPGQSALDEACGAEPHDARDADASGESTDESPAEGGTP
jgi:transposase InsO family protein